MAGAAERSEWSLVKWADLPRWQDPEQQRSFDFVLPDEPAPRERVEWVSDEDMSPEARRRRREWWLQRKAEMVW